jgi:hypothetical protein
MEYKSSKRSDLFLLFVEILLRLKKYPLKNTRKTQLHNGEVR